MSNLIDFVRNNPPKDSEIGKDYFHRLAKIRGVTPSGLSRGVELMLKRNGYKQSVNGVRDLIKGKGGPSIASPLPGFKEFDWRTSIKSLQSLQAQFQESTRSTNTPYIEIASDDPICIVLLADLHSGSWGTDYDLLVKITDELVQTPNLYAIMAGDIIQMAIKLRGVKEVSDNALPPKWQMAWLDSWLNYIYPKVLFSTWDNHSVMREENAVGYSMYQHIFEQYTTYSNGICHADVKVGDQLYKLAVSHFFRGRSMYNPVHGQMRYGRQEAHDREVILAGDSHTPGLMKYTEGGKVKVAVNCGSLQTNSGYAKRFFSLTTHSGFSLHCFAPRQKTMHSILECKGMAGQQEVVGLKWSASGGRPLCLF